VSGTTTVLAQRTSEQDANVTAFFGSIIAAGDNQAEATSNTSRGLRSATASRLSAAV
jgi:hypothetical protein